MKKLPLTILAASLLTSLTASAAVTVRYHNSDSKKHEFEATCSGSKYKAVFDGSTTSSHTIQGSAPCVVHTAAGNVTLKGGENIEIKDGKITVK